MSKVISIMENRPLEDKISALIETDNFILIYTDDDGRTYPIQGDMSMTDLALYKSMIDFMSVKSIEGAFCGEYEE